VADVLPLLSAVFFSLLQFRVTPADSLHRVGSPPPSNAVPAFRPQTADPLLNYLESSWLNPDLNCSSQNSELTRTRRHFFDSPQRATQVPHFDQGALDARLMLEEGQRAKAARDRRKHGTRGRGADRTGRPKREAQPQLRAQLHHEDFGFTDVHRTSPERVLAVRQAPLPRSILAAAATDKAEQLIAPPLPSHLYHPHSNFFRHIPNRKPREIIAALKKERDWNDRHQLAHNVEGW
jgi:hypothetical protein